MPGVGCLLRFFYEIDDLLAEGGSVESAGEEPDHQAQAIALVVADRKKEPLVRALGIGERLAVAIDHPAHRHLLAALSLEPHLAERSNGRRHVEHDRRLIQRGNCNGRSDWCPGGYRALPTAAG